MRTLTGSFNESLATTAAAIAALVKQGHTQIEVESTDQEMPEFHRADRPAYYELWRADGSALKRSESLEEQDLPLMAAVPGPPAFHAMALPDGRPGQVAFPAPCTFNEVRRVVLGRPLRADRGRQET